tara:strand:+ start:1397 stop:3016 length:1620 start_codon:yes stop_codon:yes gene_type:complete
VSNFRKVISDVLYVSKITRVGNKKLLVISVALLAQLTAVSDIAIIAIFASIIADQFTNIELINELILFILDFPILIAIMVVLRFIFLYFQQILIKNLEFNVNLNMKTYLLNEVFEKRNYSVADTYFYVNALSGHIAYFYSSFSGFLTSLLQIFIYSSYLLVVDSRSVGLFIVGVAILVYPIKKLLDAARNYMNNSYYKSQDANREIQRVVENMFLIKILKKDVYEMQRFEKSISSMFKNLLMNYKVGLVNGFLPSFLTLSSLSIVLGFSTYAKMITLDFIGVTLRLFQSLGNLTSTMNQIINSHVHIEKFYEIDNNKIELNKENFQIHSASTIEVSNLDFGYFNSDVNIYSDINFSIKKDTHVVVTGPNGSGKSTLLGLLSGVLYAQNGTVKSFSDKFGYIGATPMIFEATLLENIMYGNELNVSNEDIYDYLRTLDTFKEEESYSLDRTINNKSLSSGQMQKIAFIRAFLSDTEILLLDEATANLDDNSKDIIFKILKEKNITIINCTHDPESFENVDANLKISLDNEIRKVELIKHN